MSARAQYLKNGKEGFFHVSLLASWWSVITAACQKGRPPKSPSSHISSPSSPSNAIPKNLDLEQLDEDDFEDIDALSPTKAASILQKLDALRAKITGKAIAVDGEAATQVVKEVMQSQCGDGDAESIVKETQEENGNEKGQEVSQSTKEQKDGNWTPVLTRRKAQVDEKP
ncbi:hypothetical protein RIF29_19604 [Crotalaria pallida]|uniref:Uncharacterized protein n=1 Tax=Crotalaria pallida TaxID=3830 RepID=A0AAN9EZQ9_CROPI